MGDEVILLSALRRQRVVPGNIYVVPVIFQAHHIPGMRTIVAKTGDLEGSDSAVDAQVEEDLGIALTDAQLAAEESVDGVVTVQVAAAARVSRVLTIGDDEIMNAALDLILAHGRP
eukprot:XP_001707537.1 Hypothetical protein GL50803_21052 [Giardia lamblia ATCC 50803]